MKDVFGLVGRSLKDRYDVHSLIGEGGFGVVYRGVHRALRKPVAIKVLKLPEKLSDAAKAEVAQNFLAEAQIITSLNHPVIVAAIDFDASTMPNGQVAPWMVLEWIEGQTLASWLEKRGGQPVAPREALALFRPLCDAVAHAHRARNDQKEGVAHRDIKPANIMVVDAAEGDAPRASGYIPTTRLLDFGIAKVMQPDEQGAASGNTVTVSPFGACTLPYAAPEQVSGNRTGPWTDVHALALVFVELLVGARAYQAAEADELRLAVWSGLRPTPRTHGFDVGVWEPVLAKALAIKPADRYPNAGAFFEALAEQVPAEVRRVESPYGILNAPITLDTPSSRQNSSPSTPAASGGVLSAPPSPARKRPIAIWAAGAITLVAVVVAAVALGQRVGASAPPVPVPPLPLAREQPVPQQVSAPPPSPLVVPARPPDAVPDTGPAPERIGERRRRPRPPNPPDSHSARIRVR